MAIAKFQKVVSLFKTTLEQRLTDTATDVVLADAPGGVIQYPAWMTIEPRGSNVEIIYLPSAPSTATYASVVRGIDPESDSDTDAGFAHEHPAGAEVIISPVHRNWNELVKVMDGDAGTGSTTLRVGDETDANITVYAQNADASKPYIQYNASSNKWLISNDGTSTYDITAGGSGLTRGAGVDISGSAITLDIRSSGGLRNNQGTGSVQADVDPTIVARLDTANTWTAAQSLTAARLLITSDPATANEGVRSSYLDAKLATNIPLGAIVGTSGEAITKGQGVYIKASDGKLYKTVGNADESTFSFVGVALTTVAAADLSVSYAPPGHTVTGLAGLTAGSFYFITDTAGTLSTTPGTRFARVAIAISTTVLQVLTPKYRVVGTITLSAVSNGSTTATSVPFYPGYLRFKFSGVTGIDQLGPGVGWGVSDDAGLLSLSTNASFTDRSSNATGYVYATRSSTEAWTGAITARTNTSFTITNTRTSGTGTLTLYLQYVAESL